MSLLTRSSLGSARATGVAASRPVAAAVPRVQRRAVQGGLAVPEVAPSDRPTARLSLASMQPRGRVAAGAAAPATSQAPTGTGEGEQTMVCTSVTAPTMAAFLEEIKEAAASGVDIIELRLDCIKDFDPNRDLETLMAATPQPYIVTYRPKWEGCARVPCCAARRSCVSWSRGPGAAAASP